ncbi:MAG: trypsin-like serine protease [Coleofasciculus sp. Co-bin14]|nr:trypsin-like serine protease [Coleofasciculus sp. Co-bin14]
MKFTRGFAFTSMFGGLLATALVPFIANAQNIASGNINQQVTPQAAQAATDYWSDQRMQEAIPVEASRVGTPRTVSAQSVSPIGFPVSGLSGGSAETITPNTAPVPEAAKPQPVNLKYPFPYKSGFIPYNQYKQFPHRTIGKVFFTQVSDGANYVCSASAVNSTNKRLIVTAGHCVSDGNGKFHKNWIFVPAYNPNSSTPKDREPYGRWSACELYATTAWHKKEDFGQDIGMVKACDKSGKKLHDTVGYLGYKANLSRNQTWYAFGYPAASPFDGKKLAYCKAAYATSDSSVSPATIGIGCNMTGGSSGGPWLVSYGAGKTGAVNYINGLNSYGYSNQPNAMYSPYFGKNFLDLRTFAIKKGA